MTPTASLTNEIRGGYQRAQPFFIATADPQSLPFLLAIPPVTNPRPSFQSQGHNTDYYNIQDNASWVRGNHSFRFGGQGQFYRFVASNDVGITPLQHRRLGGHHGGTQLQRGDACRGTSRKKENRARLTSRTRAVLRSRFAGRAGATEHAPRVSIRAGPRRPCRRL